ncbi:MAG: zinc-binding alcohol dehydrogenase [Bacteroidia bacterium]|nr:zinc-binding alcohol dehydrogenase [Bacteroidia bacterium]
MKEASALWHLSAFESAIQPEPLPEPGPGWCEIEAVSSLISTGTERLVCSGQVPVELHELMKAPYMAGDFRYPVKYGYSLVGRVVTPGHALEGQAVHLLHPHQDRAIVADADIFPIPEEIPLRRAALASNVETALTAIWDSGLAPGDRALVVGFGVIGSLVARLAALMPAVTLRVLEPSPRRLALVRQLGFMPATAEDGDFDCVFHASATALGLQEAINRAGFEGRIMEMSWYGTRSVELQLGGSFHQGRKQLISTQVATLPSSHSRRWDLHRRKAVVFELLRNPLFDQHLTDELRFSELPGWFHELRRQQPPGLAYSVSYRS